MDNIILLDRNEELEELSKKLGFTRVYFKEDLVYLETKSKKELLTKTKKAKFSIYQPPTEDLLRFALEKTNVNMVVGMEKINPKDHTHYPRGGLDQITCRIAASRKKIVAFSFVDILDAKDRPKLLARMMFNIKLCKKYKVKMYFGDFCRGKVEMRGAKDLAAFFRLLGGVKVV